MSLSNLPPGVTGMEDHFGPQSAKTEHRWCPECEDDVAEVLLRPPLCRMTRPDVACERSQREDGRHDWHFDGDDPRIICGFCQEMRDALSGRVLRLGVLPPGGRDELGNSAQAEGEVEFWNSGITFTCVEGHVHDEDPEDYGPDPDRQRDEAMERDW